MLHWCKTHTKPMKFQVNTEFFNFDSRGNSKKISVGTLLTQREYNDLTQSKKDKCSVVTSVRTGFNYWTRPQVEQLVELYLQNDNLHWVRDTYMSQNPDQPHSKDSVYQTVAQLRTLDSHYLEDTQWKVTQLTEEVAIEMAEDRFGSVEDMKSLALEAQAEAILAELVG